MGVIVLYRAENRTVIVISNHPITFYGRRNYFPKNITIIIGCFNVILSIEEIDLSQYDKLKKIEKDTFWACNALKKVKLPDRITAIEDGAFFGYRCLKEINIPNKVTSIEETAFQYCEALGEKVLSQYDKFKKIKQEKRKKKDTLEKKVKEEKKS